MKFNNKIRFITLLLTFLLMVMMVSPILSLAAEAPVNLGTTSSFALLAGTTVTNTGPTTIDGDAGGDVGLSPNEMTSVVGFPPGIVSGAIYAGDAIALQAKNDLVVAYDDAASRAVTRDLTDQDLGGLTLTPGVYSFSSSAQLTGTLTLDAGGDPDGVFVFQIGSTLTTASGSYIDLIGSARYCRIFWQVGSSATLGSGSHFAGHIFALTSITANTGASIQGQLLARNGAVTLDNNHITNGLCAAASVPAPTATPEISPIVIPAITPGASSDGTPGASSDGTPGASSDGTPGTSSDGTPGTSSDGTPGTSSDGTPGTSADPSANNPKTGDNIDGSWIGIMAAVLGAILILTGIMLYLRLHGKRQA